MLENQINRNVISDRNIPPFKQHMGQSKVKYGGEARLYHYVLGNLGFGT